MPRAKDADGFEPKRRPGRPKKPTTAPPLAAVVEKAAPAILAVPPPSPKPVRARPAAKVAAAPITPIPAPAPVAAPHPIPTFAPTKAEEEQIMATVADSFTTTPADATAKMQGFVADAQGKAKSAMEKGARFYEELGDFTKGNVEAVMASSKVAASAAETMSQGLVAYGKQSVEEMTALFKSFASVKSPTELFQLQSDYARKAFDAAVAEGSKLSEKLVKVTGEIVQPISTRFALAAEKVKGASTL